MTPELERAVANAAKVFARYSLNGRIIVCKCPVCVSDETERELIRTPLQQVSSGLLSEYTHSAHGWDGKIEDDFRYFLPRYFELIASGDVPSNTGLETCLARMLPAKYREQWPQKEADAIDTFFVALFGAELTRPEVAADFGLYEAGEGTEAILCCFAHVGGDTQLLLDVWDNTKGRDTDLKIAGMLASADWFKRRLKSSWWLTHDLAQVKQAMNTVIAWLLTTDTWQRLEAACLNETDDVAAELFSQAESIVARNASKS
jgi:hypothetical protein